MKTVYFIRPIGMQGPIKIGHSASPDRRLTSLGTWSPFALEIVAQIAGGRDLEHRFHAYFLSLHERREWFRWSPEMQAVIDAINAGAFDVGTLPAPMCISRRQNGQRWVRPPEQRRKLSYSLRITHMQARSGFNYVGGDCDADRDAYLAAPHIHGEPSRYAKERVQAWLASQGAAA